MQGNVGVQNGGTLEFDVRVDVGFELRRVLVDGEIMEGITPTHFRISNIRKDTQVIVLFNEIFHNVTVSSGKGGSISTSGGLEDKISYAEKREYHISASDGYVIDSVTVNGEKVDVVNGNFVVQNQLQDCDIVVSFKKAGSSLFESSSVWMVYFFIFIALLFIFILAKIILAVIRKNKKKDLS